MKNMHQVRDLLLPGLYRIDPDGDLYVDNVTDELVYESSRGISKVRAVLNQEELAPTLKIACQRLGWPEK